MRRTLLPAAWLLILSLSSASAAPPAPSRPLPNVQAFGDVAADRDGLTVKGPLATVVLGAAGAENYRLTTELQIAPRAEQIHLVIMPTDAQDFNKRAALSCVLFSDAEGALLQAGAYRFDAATKQWAGDFLGYFLYWPQAASKHLLPLVEGLPKRTWHGRWLHLRVAADRRRISFWLDGMLVRQIERPAGVKGPVALKLQQGDRLRNVKQTPLPADGLFLPLDLAPYANDRFAQPVGKPSLEVAGVPFELPAGERDQLSLRQAQWIERKTDPASEVEAYDSGSPILHDPRMTMLRVPVEDYVAAYFLAVSDDDPSLTSTLTMRAGHYDAGLQTVQHDFVGQVPRRVDASKTPPAVAAPAGPLFHVRVPMTAAFAQDIDGHIDIELTKEVLLARHQPDPCRFRLRPLGLPSGVRIAALTLERSPLQMRVSSKEAGHAFVEPQSPAFQVRLHNITAAEQGYSLHLKATHLDGTQTEATQSGRVAAGASAEPSVAVPVKKRGYHSLSITLRDGAGKVLLRRDTSFAVLPPDTRKHRAESPFGTWDFSGGNYTCDKADEVGPLYVKMGLRYGMFGFKAEERKKYGVVQGTEPNIFLGGLKGFEEWRKASPEARPAAMIFHEQALSGAHLSRVPDLFHDRPYTLDDEEKKVFDKFWNEAIAAARAVKTKYPETHIRLGNATLPFKEVFLRRKFPAELFDSLGNEPCVAGRMPEAQPPDCVALNASTWMDRQLLDHHGYKDKPVSLCYEACYPNTNPGNLDARTQADYFVRHALHCLAWNMPEIRLGILTDVGNSYHFSNWGASGFCCRKPEMNVKPAFVAMATLTRVLDGAKLVRVLPLGSDSLHGMELRLPDGQNAYALWTVRGRRPVHLRVAAGAWKRIDDQGTESNLATRDGSVEVPLTPTPVYLVGTGKVTAAEPGAPDYDDRPAGKSTVVASLAKLDDWQVETQRSMELEYYNFMTPRRKGDFTFEPVDRFEGKEGVLKVTPRPIKTGKDTMPMYAVLAHKKGIPLSGELTEIGAWINGNSGWGRLIFELTDASGQRWISLGAQQQGVPRKWLEAMIPKDDLARFTNAALCDWNTEDVFGVSRINFDGWRYVAFPLPGNYPGEKHAWPANSQWRWDRDGVVHYPLTLRKLVVELPEKVLHVKTFAPPARRAIFLKDLTVGQR